MTDRKQPNNKEQSLFSTSNHHSHLLITNRQEETDLSHHSFYHPTTAQKKIPLTKSKYITPATMSNFDVNSKGK